MCTFCSNLPSNEYGGDGKKAFITLFLKPNDPSNPKESYRFRLLNYRSPTKNNRSYPFISRYVHNHWSVNENGIRVVDDYMVCPSTPYIDARNDLELGYADSFKELKLRDKKPTWDNICPICKHVAEAWNAWKSSGKTDKMALDRISALKKQFQGVVPVYVINDPVNPKNNGRFKCIIFNNQPEYKSFIELVNTEIAKVVASKGSYQWCNGDNAVDFYLRMEKVPVVYKNGNQGTTRKITKMKFGQKAYDLVDNNGNPIVTKENIDRFEFDDQYYVKNTKSELEEFYSKYFSLVSNNIPDEDIDSIDSNQVQTVPDTEKIQIPQNQNAGPSKPTSSLVNDLVDDPDDIPFEDKDESKEPEQSSQSVEELLKQLDFKDDD